MPFIEPPHPGLDRLTVERTELGKNEWRKIRANFTEFNAEELSDERQRVCDAALLAWSKGRLKRSEDHKQLGYEEGMLRGESQDALGLDVFYLRGYFAVSACKKHLNAVWWSASLMDGSEISGLQKEVFSGQFAKDR